jgi:uncharacterized protein
MILLDVNVLVALFDAAHVNHEAAHQWFASVGHVSWATCPITENGCVHVLSNPAYPSAQATPREVVARLARFCEEQGHEFWPDDVSLLTALEPSIVARLQGPAQLTDFSLAALARHHEGRCATFDGSLVKTLAGTTLEPALMLLR